MTSSTPLQPPSPEHLLASYGLDLRHEGEPHAKPVALGFHKSAVELQPPWFGGHKQGLLRVEEPAALNTGMEIWNPEEVKVRGSTRR